MKEQKERTIFFELIITYYSLVFRFLLVIYQLRVDINGKKKKKYPKSNYLCKMES